MFKSRYLEFFTVKASSTYQVYNPKGLRLITRLRIGLSNLRHHKFKHNFKDTLNPYCSCDNISIEDCCHYLLHCPLFAHDRCRLFTDLQNLIHFLPLSDKIKEMILLYGYKSFDTNLNTAIIEKTITYIINTERFVKSIMSE